MHQDTIVIRGLRQNNLKNVSLDIPKGKIVVFTGVSGSGEGSRWEETGWTITARLARHAHRQNACGVCGRRE